MLEKRNEPRQHGLDEKYKNKYRIQSARLQNWNYGWAGAYFITICTKNRESYLGKIVNGKIQLSNIGILADVFLYEIRNHSKNVELGEFVVMPNHVHLILILHNDKKIDDDIVVVVVETRHALSLQSQSQQQSQPQPQQQSQQQPQQQSQSQPQSQPQSQQQPQPQPQSIGKNRFQNQGKNTVSSIIGSYKSAVTKHAHRLGYEFGWQSRFYDYIIRNNTEYERIKNYIINNPQNWEKDENYYE